ncbi:MAG: sulfite exporter TauE/SafE family protein [Hyphomonadaceae bacterium]
MMSLIAEYWPMMAALLAAGLFAGLTAGLFGIGGGVVIVPVLFYLFTALGYGETAMHVAVTTSLATIIATSIRSVSAHNTRGAVDWSVLREWAPWIGLGAILGMVASAWISGRGMTIIFGSVALLLSLQFFFGRPDWKLADDLPRGAVRGVLGSVLGALSALMGIGGGAMGVTLMTVCGRPMHQSVGTAAGFGIAIGLPGALLGMIVGWNKQGLPPFSLGHVNLIAFVCIAAMTVAVAPLGARLAHAMDARLLKKLFAVALAFAAMNMLRQSVFG